MDPVIVIGAGIAGVSCARTLAGAGVPVLVLERDQQAGGRVATAEHAGRPVDIGASYFTVSDDRFDVLVQDWQRRGLARPWTDTFEVYGGGPAAGIDAAAGDTAAGDTAAGDTAAGGAQGGRALRRSSSGPLRWAAPAGLQALVRDLAVTAGLRVEQSEVGLVTAGNSGPAVDGRAAAAVVLAMPDPQARAILHPALAAERAGLHALYEPVLALSAGWPRRCWAQLDGVFVHGDPRLSWIADDGSRRGDGAPVLVAHSTPSWAAEQLCRHDRSGRLDRSGQLDGSGQLDESGQLDGSGQLDESGRLDQPGETVAAMLQALSQLLGIDTAPSWTRLDQWPQAKPAAGRAACFQLWPSMVGACGDSWSPRPRVEAAFLSGLRLGAALAARLGPASTKPPPTTGVPSTAGPAHRRT